MRLKYQNCNRDLGETTDICGYKYLILRKIADNKECCFLSYRMAKDILYQGELCFNIKENEALFELIFINFWGVGFTLLRKNKPTQYFTASGKCSLSYTPHSWHFDVNMDQTMTSSDLSMYSKWCIFSTEYIYTSAVPWEDQQCWLCVMYRPGSAQVCRAG